jgi:cytochrome c-type biogenesis protein CcmH
LTQFWVLACVLAAIALAFMLVPLWQHRRRSGQASHAAILLAIATVPAAVTVYLQTTTWAPGGTAAVAPEVDQMIETLADRLEQAPDDVEGWRLLGRSYLSLGRYAEAEQSLRQAWVRTPVPDDELKLALAEAQVLLDPERLSGEAGRLFEEVVKSDPQNMKALWYSGLAALEAQQTDTARERWARLLALGPPPSIAQILEAQLASLGGLKAAPPNSGPREDSGQPAAAGTEQTIEIDVRLAPDLALPALGPEAALFIFARAPAGGPPIAVVRVAADAVPGRVTLSDGNAMLPGRTLGDFQELTLVARLSLTGQPTGAPGDLSGEKPYRPGLDAGPIELVINRVE